MTRTDHDNLKDRHKQIVKALNDANLNYADFKDCLHKAYGIEKQETRLGSAQQTLRRIAEKELEFVEACLEGRGPRDTQAFARDGDLTEVLLIEIGTHPDAVELWSLRNRNDHDEGSEKRRRGGAAPSTKEGKIAWMMGDWMFLAERIVHAIRSSDHFMEKESVISPHPAKDVLRIWPTFKPKNWSREKDPGGGNFSPSRLVGVKLDGGEVDDEGKPDPDNEHVQVIRVNSTNDTYLAENHNWVILPCGPGKVPYPEGVPSHLWSSFWVKDRLRERR